MRSVFGGVFCSCLSGPVGLACRSRLLSPRRPSVQSFVPEGGLFPLFSLSIPLVFASLLSVLVVRHVRL